jgi:hypothetical protein
MLLLLLLLLLSELHRQLAVQVQSCNMPQMHNRQLLTLTSKGAAWGRF